MDKDAWIYHTPEDLAPGIQRLLRTQVWTPRFERLPVPLSRSLMEVAAWLTNPPRNHRLIRTVQAHRLQEAGVPIRVRIFSNMIHAFANLLVVPEAYAAARECIHFLKDHFEKHQTDKETTDGKEQSPGRTGALAT